MNPRFASVAATALVLGVLARAGSAQTLISVIEPGTNKLVHFAVVAVRPIDTAGPPLAQGRTGLSGEPWFLPNLDAPPTTTLQVVARKNGISGTMRLTYDADRDFWKPNHTLGDWRPETVYTFDKLIKNWRAVPFAEWKAPHAARKQAFATVDGALALAMTKDQVDAQTTAAATAAETALADLARQGHVRSDLKGDLDTILKTLTSPAPQTVISPSLKQRIESLRSKLADSEVRSRVEPPTISVMMDRPFEVPVRRYGPVGCWAPLASPCACW